MFGTSSTRNGKESFTELTLRSRRRWANSTRPLLRCKGQGRISSSRLKIERQQQQQQKDTDDCKICPNNGFLRTKSWKAFSLYFTLFRFNFNMKNRFTHRFLLCSQPDFCAGLLRRRIARTKQRSTVFERLGSRGVPANPSPGVWDPFLTPRQQDVVAAEGPGKLVFELELDAGLNVVCMDTGEAVWQSGARTTQSLTVSRGKVNMCATIARSIGFVWAASTVKSSSSDRKSPVDRTQNNTARVFIKSTSTTAKKKTMRSARARERQDFFLMLLLFYNNFYL